MNLQDDRRLWCTASCVVSTAQNVPQALLTDDRVTRLLRILHGFEDPAGDPRDRNHWPGCGGLREIFWIVETSPVYLSRSLMGNKPVDESARMIPADDKDLTCCLRGHNGAAAALRDFELVQSGEGLEKVGSNRWTGINKPLMSFQRIGFHS